MNLLFDLDDTLYPEKQYIFQGFWAVSNYIGDKYKIDKNNLYIKLVSIFKNGSLKIFDDIIFDLNLNDSPLTLMDIYRKSPRKLVYYNEVEDALKYLKKEEHTLILMTNGDSDTQWRKIRILKTKGLFDEIYVLDDFGKEFWKPSTLILDKIYNVYGNNESENYMIIGNGYEDLEFARNAHIEFVFIDRENAVRKINYFDEENDLIRIKDLFQFVDLIGGKRSEK